MQVNLRPLHSLVPSFLTMRAIGRPTSSIQSNLLPISRFVPTRPYYFNSDSRRANRNARDVRGTVNCRTLSPKSRLIVCGFLAMSQYPTGPKHELKAPNHFTSGRWLWREHQQLARRYVNFDMPRLLEIAASATGSNACVQVLKVLEGQYNKVFLLTMDDGREVIAKLPNPNAGRPHFTTASEVATMDFV